MTKATANLMTSSATPTPVHLLQPYWPSFLFLKHTGHHPTSGPLHWQLLLSRTLFFKTSSFPHLLQFLLNVIPLLEEWGGIQVRARGNREVSIPKSHHLTDLQTCSVKLRHQ